MKSFFGLDLTAGTKVVLWVHLIENVALYVMSLMLMMNYVGELKRFQSVLLYQDELDNLLKLGKIDI